MEQKLFYDELRLEFILKIPISTSDYKYKKYDYQANLKDIIADNNYLEKRFLTNIKNDYYKIQKLHLGLNYSVKVNVGKEMNLILLLLKNQIIQAEKWEQKYAVSSLKIIQGKIKYYYNTDLEFYKWDEKEKLRESKKAIKKYEKKL